MKLSDLTKHPDSPLVCVAKAIHAGHRIPSLEPTIAKDPHWAVKYAVDIIKGPFKLAEKTIATQHLQSYDYATTVLKGPFPLGEPAIAKDPYWAEHYAFYLQAHGFVKDSKRFMKQYNVTIHTPHDPS